MAIEPQPENVAVSVLTHPSDSSIAAHTVPHLLQQFKSQKLFVIVDRSRGTTRVFEELVSQWKNDLQAVILDIPIGKEGQATAKRHFGRKRLPFSDFRGVPLLAWAHAVDTAKAHGCNYLAHFDGDILLHCEQGAQSFIDKSIQIHQKHPDLLVTGPLPGPPAPDGPRGQPNGARLQDDLWLIPAFTSRRFVIDVNKLEQYLPMPIRWTSSRRRILQFFTGKSAVWNWEYHMNCLLHETKLFRGDQNDINTWAIHLPDHSQHTANLLPEIIAHVESGWAPESQSGKYDLELAGWQQAPNQTRRC